METGHDSVVQQILLICETLEKGSKSCGTDGVDFRLDQELSLILPDYDRETVEKLSLIKQCLAEFQLLTPNELQSSLPRLSAAEAQDIYETVQNYLGADSVCID